MKVVWTEQALSRLAEIERYIAADDPEAAQNWSLRLLERAAALAELPGMGRRVPEISLAPLRELILGNCRLVYRVRPEAVEVLTVFESHRLLPEDDLSPEK